MPASSPSASGAPARIFSALAAARDGVLGVLLGRLGRAQARRPGLFSRLGLALSLVAALLCTRLTSRMRFEDFLPEQSSTRRPAGELAGPFSDKHGVRDAAAAGGARVA